MRYIYIIKLFYNINLKIKSLISNFLRILIKIIILKRDVIIKAFLILNNTPLI